MGDGWKSAERFQRERGELLDQIVTSLRDDTRFLVAWLGGSFGRREEDAYSDLDLWLVVADRAVSELCATTIDASASRLELVASFGDAVIVHEHHANAPGDGAFTAVIYRSGLAVDWTFLPQSQAARSIDTRLLYNSADVSVDSTVHRLEADEIANRLSERLAFFWLVALPAAKAWRRGDSVRFHAVLDLMHRACQDIDAILVGERPIYTRHSLAPFCATPEEQRVALIDICRDMNQRSGAITAAGGTVPDAPEEALKAWVAL